ncbi:MAG: MBL fold metallo-hydrolase [Bacteroidetes bacterium]|nr:MBL fold metallo-hydrolase [Bacteroidota bacterium]
MRNLFILGFALLLGCFTTFSQEDVETDKKNRKKKESKDVVVNEDSDSTEGNNTPNNYKPTSGISIIKVTDSIFMLKGKGGNIGVSIGDDGVFMIDNQFAEATPAILQNISRLSSKPIQFLINTHHHEDHTGGNKNMNDLGTIIYSHDNVKKRLIEEVEKKAESDLMTAYEQKIEKLSKDGNNEKAEQKAKESVESIDQFINKDNIYPMITFSEQLTFYYNGEKIMLFHVENAHTDGDVMVYFTKSNVLHTGDAFFNGKYPFIDVDNGGSFRGNSSALSKILMVADKDTKIIPGHGDLATIEDVKYTQSMISFLTERIVFHIVSKKTEKEILQMKDLTKEFDNKGFGDGFISTEKFIKALYKDMSKKYRYK